jgi:hypothetical protein
MSTGRAEPLDLDSLRRHRADILRLTERYGASNVRVFGPWRAGRGSWRTGRRPVAPGYLEHQRILDEAVHLV